MPNQTHIRTVFSTAVMKPMSPKWIVAFCIACVAIANAADAETKLVSYNRDIAPILADKCYECHGPDAEQRQAGLRLDTQAGATSELDSGATAIVGGDTAASELVARISSTDDDLRMPPPDHNKTLTTTERNLLTTWIEQGPQWQLHWSLARLAPITPPTVADRTSRRNAIDDFVLSRLEQIDIRPAPRAERQTLVRRVYLDLIGLSPTRDEVTAFLNNTSTDAYGQLVERLLSSPHYGERWGRHWLDVARYGDSNGGDENHSYPHAFRYRNYVIDTLNQDIPYDQFVLEQLAGDLVDDGNGHLSGNSNTSSSTKRQPLSGTGFLAIGMKILAEQDPIKKRADMVDEQIDTTGRALLGLSLGCARCHDHKFDPISTADYYSLAGVFQSTNVKDRPLLTDAYTSAKARYDEAMSTLVAQRTAAEQQLSGSLGEKGILQFEAESMVRGDAAKVTDGYGEGIGIISDPGVQECFAEYDIEVPESGSYVFQIRYAALNARPGELVVNGEIVKSDIMSTVTGGWYPQHQQWVTEHVLELDKGPTTLRLNAKSNMVHIDKLRLIFSAGGIASEAITQMDRINEQISELEKTAPSPTQVMAVTEGDVHNVQIHTRGSHLDLGDEVARQFPAVLSANDIRLPPNESGRLQMARWMTDQHDGAGHLAARVIANRIWHWHFGKGLVATPDDFGIRGTRPTHPELLDFLASYLIESNWSLKSLHRLIVTSSTYQMRSQHRDTVAEERDPTNEFYWRRDSRRLDAESLRDLLISSTNQLDRTLGGSSITVKSQDPSPADLDANTKAYEGTRRRSVYLPIVRSNVYELLTLFDFPNAASPVGKRDETVVPTQALMLLNSPFVVQQANAIIDNLLADSLETSSPPNDDLVADLFWRLFGREPSSDEQQEALEFVAQMRDASDKSDTHQADRSAWAAFCQTLLMSNEFLFVE